METNIIYYTTNSYERALGYPINWSSNFNGSFYSDEMFEHTVARFHIFVLKKHLIPIGSHIKISDKRGDKEDYCVLTDKYIDFRKLYVYQTEPFEFSSDKERKNKIKSDKFKSDLTKKVEDFLVSNNIPMETVCVRQ